MAARKPPQTGEILTREEREAYETAIAEFEETDRTPAIYNDETETLPNGWGDFTNDQLSEVFISVCRLPVNGSGPEEKITRVRASEYTHDELETMIQENWGRGKYKMRGYRNGQLVKGMIFEFSCADPINREKAPAPVVQPQAGFDMQMAQMSMMTGMVQMVQNMMAGQAEAMRAMVESIRGNQQPQNQPNMLELLAVAKDLFKPEKTGMPDNPMEWLTKGMELAGNLAGGGEPSTMGVLKDLVSSVGPVLTEAMKSRPAQAPQQKPPMQAIPKMIPPPPMAPKPAPAQADIDQFMQDAPPAPIQLPPEDGKTRLLNALHVFYTQGTDPQAAVNFIEPQLDDDQFSEVVEFFSQPDWIRKVIQYDQRFTNAVDWLGMAAAAFMSRVLTEDENDIDSRGIGELTDENDIDSRGIGAQTGAIIVPSEAPDHGSESPPQQAD